MPELLSRAAILGAPDIVTEDVHVPEWGGWVRVRGLTGAERDKLESEIVELRGKQTRVNMQNFRAKLCALAIVNAEGERMFGDADVKALGEKSAAALQRVFDIAQRLSGLTDEDVEELTKN